MTLDADQLTIVLEGQVVQTVPLRAGRVRIGRAADNDVVLSDPSISRHHAEVEIGPDGFAITDLGSAAGTIVDGQPISPHQPAVVMPGAAIQIGPYALTYAGARPADASRLSDEITSITDPLLQAVVRSPDELVATSLRRVLAEAGPRQAEVLRRCAIPRWFDLAVLAVLREREDGNERILELLSGYSFVRELGGGRYAYHDAMRDALLQEWREQRPDELRAINVRLAEHFGDRVRTTEQFRALPKGPAPTTISAMPAGDWDLWAREALYHRLMADPIAGMERLHAMFDQLEATHRLAEAEALLQVTREVPLDETGRSWVRYLQARLEHAALRLDDAAEQIGAILAQPVLDPLLAAEARQTMGDICAETGQWARATDLYRDSLGYFEATGKQHQAAETMLRLGEAYQGLAQNTGGWNVPAYPRNHFWSLLGRAWQWLQSLPFLLLSYFSRRTPWTLPRPEHLGSYQNWLLVRLYRTAQDWYDRARDAFVELADDAGRLRAEQHLAEILLIFGYADDALARLAELHERPAARDPYVRLWLECGRAAALIAKGQIAEARRLLDAALPHFQELGDVRREAAVLALQARAAEAAGENATALELYRRCLTRFRALRYTAAREQVLYAMRAWRRHVGPGPTSQQIGALLAEEPEKRYVARFPRSQIPLLQVLSLVAIPLALLLLALLLPNQVVRPVAGTPLPELLTSYSPWRALFVLVALLVLYSAAYTVVALLVIFFIPIVALEREQPDYLVTDAEGVARYDYRGALAERMSWAEISRWIRVDRRIWVRPLPLFSETFLEAADGRDLRIDGITGWYTSVQEDIRQHLRAAGNQLASADRGFRILRSKMSLFLAIGLPLLLLFLAAESGWANWLVLLLPAPVYAALAFLVFSGGLMLVPLAYWLVTQPLALRRSLDLHSRWPYIIGAVGLAAIVLYLFSGGLTTPQIRALFVGLLLWGAYIVADVAYTLWWPRSQAAGLASMLAALLVAAGIVYAREGPVYYAMLGQAAARQALLGSSSQAINPLPVAASAAQAIDAADKVVDQPGLSTDQQIAQAYINKGNAYYATGDYAQAETNYKQATEKYQALLAGGSEEAKQGYAVALAGYARSLQKQGKDWEPYLLEACNYYPGVAAECPGQ